MTKIKPHDNGQDHAPGVLICQTAQKFPNEPITAQTAKNQSKGSCSAQNNEDHAGELHGGAHDVSQYFEGKFLIGQCQHGSTHRAHGSGLCRRCDTGKNRSQDGDH